MTYKEVIKHLCQTVGVVFNTIKDYSKASDCFCNENARTSQSFLHSGITLKYVRDAVIEKLKRDGYNPDEVLEKILTDDIQGEAE